MFVDSHCHIDGTEYDFDRAEVLQHARAAGVVMMLNIGTGDPHSGALERAVELAESHENIYAAIGTHPHDARLFDDRAEEQIKTLIAGSSKVIAWGEIGLDYHYDNSPREVQREAFRRQLWLAREARLPVIIHTREAEDETIEILRSEWEEPNNGVIMHCFSGPMRLAQACLELGFLISFAGNVTFKKAEALREVAVQIPLDRLLIETDCPYLTPVPFRGRRNEPAHVVETARCLADLRGVPVEELGQITTANFCKLFQLKIN